MATTFDAATLTVGETRVAMVDDMYMDHATTSGNFAVSASGGLAYTPGHPSDFERRLIAIDPNKPGAEYETLLGERRSYTRPRMSPDGRLIAAPASAWRDRIWIIDVGRQTFSRLSSTPFSVENDVVWSPDSKFVAFRGERLNDDVEALYRVRGEGGQPAELLYASKDALAPTSWAPDNQSIVLQTRKPDGDIDLALYSFGATPAVRPLLQTQYVEQGGSISPDGQLIAYSSNQSGRTEVWVSAFPSMTSAVRVSIDGGLMPEWAKKGRRLFFRDGLAILAADFSGSTPSRPVVVGRIPAVIPGVGVDTMPDGRLLAIDGPSLGATPELRIVLNWFKELRDKVK
jgi:Tol biopolymer transport system component